MLPENSVCITDFNMLTGPFTAWERSCVEIGDIVCSNAHMMFDLISVHTFSTHDGIQVDIFQCKKYF